MFMRFAAAAALVSALAACSTDVATPPTPAAPAAAITTAAVPAAAAAAAQAEAPAPAATATPLYPLSEAAALEIAAKLGLKNPTDVIYLNAEKHERAHGVKVKGDPFNHFVWMMETGKRRVCIDANTGEVLENVK